MVNQDARGVKDGGTCVLGAGVAVYAIPKGCRKPKQVVVIPSSFQGGAAGHQAARRAINYLKQEGVDAYWYDGIMD